MCATSCTSVVPSAASPASTSAAPARMSCARTGAPESRSRPADHRVVAVGAHVGAEPGQLVDEHPARLEDVLGDHRGAVGHGVEREHHGLQVGREARVRQRHDVDGPRPVVHPHPEAVRRRASRRRRPARACPGRSRGGRRARRARTRRRGSCRPRPPRCRRRCGRAASGARPAQPLDALDLQRARCRRRRSARPWPAGTRTGRRCRARARRCRSSSCPWPAPRP